RPGFCQRADAVAGEQLFRWLADASEPGAGADVPFGSAVAGRADQPPGSGCDPLAGSLAQELSRYADADFPRPRLPRRGGWSRGACRTAQTDPLSWRLFGLRAGPCRTAGATAAGL